MFATKQFIFRENDTDVAKTIEIYGTPDEPWFKGAQIDDVLGYLDTSKAIYEHVDVDDKKQFNEIKKNIGTSWISIEKNKGGEITHLEKNIVPFQGEQSTHLEKSKKNYIHPQTIFINESGLYSLMFKSNMHYAKQFQRWVVKEVLPSIRKTGSYDISQTKQHNLPKMIMYDINDYTGKHCVYLLLIEGSIYKYGISSNFKERLAAHKKDLAYKEIIKIYTLDNMTLCKNVEDKIKLFMKQNNLNIAYKNHVEIFDLDSTKTQISDNAVNKWIKIYETNSSVTDS